MEQALLGRLTLGDHVCWAVDDDRVRQRTAAAFLRDGLRARQRVLYCGGAPETLLAALDELGVDTSAALMAGQLEAVTAEESYLAGGVFDALAVLASWRPMAEAARDAGFTGMRVLGDMTWAMRDIPGREDLLWYESQVNRIMLDNDLIGVCAYDRRLFDPLELRRLTWQHPGTASTGAPFDEMLSLRVRRTRKPVGLVLSGEADLSNRQALRAVFEHLFADAGTDEVTVDVSALRFADHAAAMVMVDAGGGPSRLHLVGCSPSLLKLLEFCGADDAKGLTIDPAPWHR